jgi:heptaprenyl diphosphate synthase
VDPQQQLLVQNKQIAAMAMLVALGVILHRVEALLPLPSPGVKRGLANIMTLIALIFLGFKEACVVTVLRILLSSILGGTFLSPTFFLSFAGGIAAILIMRPAYQTRGGPFSLLGVSVLSACAHTLTIFGCVYLFLIPQDAFLNLLPIFFTLALVSGIFNGIAANHITRRLLAEGISLK